MKLSHSRLHYHIMKSLVDHGTAPKIKEMREVFDATEKELVTALKELQAYHGVVLHPKSSEVWVMHPFSTAPTNFFIESKTCCWWGNCAWCSLGAAALLNRDVTITTTSGGESKQIIVKIKNGQIENQNLYIHFPIPMLEAWDNVTFTCSTMLMFESEKEIDDWCIRHKINKGDVQSISKIWEFSKVWYGNHLKPDWEKWTVDEAKEIFQRFELINPIWAMPSTSERF